MVNVESDDKKRAPSPIISPVKQSLQSDSNNYISPMRKSKRQRIEAPKVALSKLEPKVYLNKRSKINSSYYISGINFNPIILEIPGEFMTGFNPMTKDAKYKRQMRMQRFGKHEVKDKEETVNSKIEEDGDEDRFENYSLFISIL